MANMYCKNQKANSEEYNKNYDANFRRKVRPKDANAVIFVKKEDLPRPARDVFYPEEKRRQENDRLVKKAESVGVGKDYWPGQTRKEA